ncbi:MAG TPA: UDP-N-acetylmuramoyl-L-alanyl-D-glutamate--2,6-diaminopimelate ligase [Acidimicrobiales bacterium]
MRLDRLLDDVEVLDLAGDPATDVMDVTYSSAAARAGSLFCCLRGLRSDGHAHAPAAVEGGAVALLVDRDVDVARPVAQVRVPDTRVAMAPIAAAFHGYPSKKLDVVGTTGTNGKGTTTMLVRSILEHAGRPTGILGTMNSARTTPEAPDLQASLAGFAAEGKVAAAIEVSSVGLASHRVDAVSFAVGIFTNLSVDELAIHGSMDAYFAAKATLFERGRTAVGVVNADDEWGRRLLDRPSIEMRPYSLSDARDLDVRVGSSTFSWRGERTVLPLDAEYNVMNALAAMTAAEVLGVAADVAAGAMSSIEPLAGHGDVVDEGQGFRVVVDFAHTAGALAAVLAASRRAAAPGGRVIAVFGCGGDRDPGRRAPMGEAASTHADVVIVTSDNPRTEDPLAIIGAVVDGARGAVDGGRATTDVRVVPDRRAAIAEAVDEARDGDVVVIAGKGHETGQIVGTEVLPFDDHVVAREALANRGYRGGSA